jgi:hypothetical protein
VSDDYIKILTGPTKKALADIDKRTDRATMYALRAMGRKVKQEARRRAPVYKGDRATMSLKDVKAGRKAGKVASHQRVGRQVHAPNLVEGNAVVPGLLKDSISSSKRFKRRGTEYGLGIAPRGVRVHLYSGKAEATHHYMAAGYEAALHQLDEVAAKAWGKAMERK